MLADDEPAEHDEDAEPAEHNEDAEYRVDEGPNAARKRARDTMAPLNNKNNTPTYPLIPHREFPTVVTD
jgi:hypothetical protein